MFEVSTLADAEVRPIRIFSRPAPAVALADVLATGPAGEAVAWDPPCGPAAVAFGATHRIVGEGARRFAQVSAASERLWRRLRRDVGDDSPAPRVWGGFAFAPGAARQGPWEAFGDASFTLPRLCYWRDGDRAWMQGIGSADDGTLDDDVDRAIASLRGIARAAGDARAARAYQGPGVVDPVDRHAWTSRIDAILAAIGRGRVDKVVAALCTRVVFDASPTAAQVLASLRDETGPVRRFVFTRPGASFVGASPELLVARSADELRSEALAGTIARADGAAAALLASAKDRAEHAFVREAIAAALAPLCERFDVPEEPQVRELRRLLHLATPMRGRLSGDTHVLELCERLHPTPATCGTPRDTALAMIRASEEAPRGWYASPVGWFDARGDGEFAVALRCALIARDGVRVYAGAGIVSGSDPTREREEVEIKQQAILSALGLGDA